MITSVAIGTILSAYEDEILKYPHVKPYVIPGWSYTSNLSFDDKVRKKIVLQDDKMLASKDKPLWLAKLWSREAIKTSTPVGSRPFQVRGHIVGEPMSGHASKVPARLATVALALGLVSNSITFLEHIEELTWLTEFRQNYESNFASITESSFRTLLETYDPFTIHASTFSVDSLTKEDTSQYGPIVQITLSVEMTYPITVPTKVMYPLITAATMAPVENYLF